MCFIELVDYDDNMAKEKVTKKSTRTRRSKRVTNDEVEVVSEGQIVEESKVESN